MKGNPKKCTPLQRRTDRQESPNDQAAAPVEECTQSSTVIPIPPGTFSIAKESEPNLGREDQTARPRSRKEKKKEKTKEKTKTEKSKKPDDPNDAATDPTSAPIMESSLNVKPFNLNSTTSSTRRKRVQISKRWKEKLEKLQSADESEVTRTGSMIYVNDAEFVIAGGRDGTKVFLGLRDDGTEMFIKKTSKSNNQELKNEEDILRLPALDGALIVRYVDSAEDEKFQYLGLQLCEYTLEEYTALELGYNVPVMEVVRQVLRSLKVLHGHNPPTVHLDLKPTSVWIDVNEGARLADFGRSRRLTTETRYMLSADIQAMGKLIYYILSGGLHPEYNIRERRYTLDHVQDLVAKDLIEWMINEEPEKRPKVKECLSHPFFFSSTKRLDYLRRTGNKKKLGQFRITDKKLNISLDEWAGDGSFKQWKEKFPSDLVEEMDSWNKPYPETTLGLLRFIQNLHEHRRQDEDKLDLMSMFPDLFGYVYTFGISKGWHFKTPLKEMFGTEVFPRETITTRSVMPNSKEHLNTPAQESRQVFTRPFAN